MRCPNAVSQHFELWNCLFSFPPLTCNQRLKETCKWLWDMHDVVFVEMLYLVQTVNTTLSSILIQLIKKNTKNYQTCHLSGIINFNHVRVAWVILAILFSAQVLFSKEISFFSLLINYSINQQRWWFYCLTPLKNIIYLNII